MEKFQNIMINFLSEIEMKKTINCFKKEFKIKNTKDFVKKLSNFIIKL